MVVALAELVNQEILLVPHVGSELIGIDGFAFLKTESLLAENKSLKRFLCLSDSLVQKNSKLSSPNLGRSPNPDCLRSLQPFLPKFLP
tara:strand:+ start:10895 stop:11158 length:264 start_codon:yes stop_codon:yes gene_type:complete